MKSLDIKSFFMGFFDKLEKLSLDYVILHSYDNLPYQIESDVDYCVRAKNLKSIIPILYWHCRASGWRLVQILQHETTALYCVCTSIDHPHEVLQLDVCSDYLRKGRHIYEADFLLANRRKHTRESFYIPSVKAEFAYVLAKGEAKLKAVENLVSRLEELWSQGEQDCQEVLLSRYGLEMRGKFDIDKLKSIYRANQSSIYKAKRASYFRDFRRIFKRILRPSGFCLSAPNIDDKASSEISELMSLSFRKMIVSQPEQKSFHKKIIQSYLVLQRSKLRWSQRLFYAGNCIQLDYANPVMVVSELNKILEKRVKKHWAIDDKGAGFITSQKNVKSISHAHLIYPAFEGISTYCDSIASNMHSLGVQMSILTMKKRKPYNPPVACNVNYAYAPSFLETLLNCSRHLSAEACDVVVLHGMFQPRLLLLSLLLRLKKMPYIFVPHDPYSDIVFSKASLRKKIYWHVFEKRMIKHAKSVQVLMPDHELCLRRRNVKCYIENIPNGCHIEQIQEPEFVVPEKDEMRLLYLGRVDKQRKGLDLLMESLSYLNKKSYANLTITLTGKSNGDHVILEEMLNTAGHLEKVYYTGVLKREVSEIIREHDVLILPSRFDGFGLVVLEAIAAGKPVIVSNGAGVHEIIVKSNSGVIVKPTPESIAGGIEEMFSRKGEWQAMAKRGQEYIVQHSNWRAVSKKTLSFYNRVVSL